MTKWIGVLGGGTAAAAAVGAGLYMSGVLQQPAPAPVPQQAAVPSETTPAAQPGTSEASDTAAASEPTAEVAPEPETTAVAAPSFDLVRVEPDGSALVAGTGAAEALIRVLLDGAEVAESQSGTDGKFVSLMVLKPSDKPRMLSLQMLLDGKEYLSDTDIIVAPFGAAPEVASADEAEAPQEEVTAAEDGGETELAQLEPEQETQPEPVEEQPKPDDAPVEQPPAAPQPEATAPADTAALDPVSEVAEQTEPDQPSGTELAETQPVTDDVPQQEAAPVPDPVAEMGEAVAETVEASEAEDQAAPEEAPTQHVENPETSPEPVETAAEQSEPDTPDTTPALEEVAETTTETETETDAPLAQVEPAAPAPDQPDAPQTAEAEAPDIAPEQPTAVADAEPDPQPEPPKLLASDEEGVRILAGPEILDSVAIDTISYDAQGDVALAGRGVGSEGGGFVRIYLDNSPITSSRIRDDGSWRVALPEVDKGVYTLRVDEVDEEGTVKSRAETPFQREDRETLERVAAEKNSDAPVDIITVQPGNTLWQIARERYGEGLLYVRVFDANREHIRNPDLIYPGQVFDLPETAD